MTRTRHGLEINNMAGRRMLDQLSVRTFKSLDDVTVDLGLVNVFIGANGSGKSNLLEALGILSAAADGGDPESIAAG